jgi:hypothetical protein
LNGAASTAAGRSSVDIHERQACMTSAGHASRMHCEAGHERLTLRLDNQALHSGIPTVILRSSKFTKKERLVLKVPPEEVCPFRRL